MRDLIKRLAALEQASGKTERYLCEYENGTTEWLSAHELFLYPLLCRNNAFKDEVLSITKLHCKSAGDPFVLVPLCVLESVGDRPRPEVIIEKN